MADLTAQEIIDALGMEPHPTEGGWFVETYRCPESAEGDGLPGRYAASRTHSTAIYYLLTPDTFSEIHRLRSDEVYHFYLGDPVEMLQLRPNGTGEVLTLGTDLASGQRPQVLVPREVWQGSRLVEGGRFALLGCTVAPGFEPEDYDGGAREDLVRRYPEYASLIKALTRQG
jgi:predicted cupin superfamily sugar epimerase